jgi:hypothetical protein
MVCFWHCHGVWDELALDGLGIGLLKLARFPAEFFEKKKKIFRSGWWCSGVVV